MNRDIPEDPQRRALRGRLEEIHVRSVKASSWRDSVEPLRSLINRQGHVPISARLAAADLDFLAEARDDLLCFSELGIRLLDLHQPRDAGGITSDTANPILRCRSCMWRWPCPTFRAMADAFTVRQPTAHGETPAGQPMIFPDGLTAPAHGTSRPDAPAGHGEPGDHDTGS